jgi:DNA-binding NarL/FixJ family response regulator
VKEAAPRELLDAVNTASRFEAHIHPGLQRKLIEDYVSRARGNDQGSTLDGLTGREIAESLVINPNTVERHQLTVMAKLGLHNRAELVRYAIRKGLVEVD